MESLNDAQRKAATTLEGPLLVLAGAGAGKTKTVVARITQLIKSGVPASEILAITFTNKAAAEMRERVTHAIGEGAPGDTPFVSTFHALGVEIIKQNAARVGLPRFFSILDRSDSKSIVKECLEKIGYDPKQYDPGKILGVISREKGDAVSQSAYGEANSRDYFGSVVARVWDLYDKEVRRRGALDFDDLLVVAYDIVKDPAVQAQYAKRWRYIHVDEYQDTNVIQYKLVKLLAGAAMNVCAVGDIDQNIYSWRGAKLRNILDFERDYPGAPVILLEENYRSTETILAAANAAIAKNVHRREKRLFTRRGQGDPISLYEAYDEMSEAEFIATKAEGLIAGGVDPGDIAVLYRANFQSRAIEEAFIAYGVSYNLLGTRYFDRKEVKDVLAYLKAALEPKSLPDVVRALQFPSRGIGKVSLAKILEGNSEGLTRSARASYDAFQGLLMRIREAAEGAKPSEIVRFIVRESGIEDALSKEGEDGAERLGNIKELASLAARHDDMPGIPGIEAFITSASLHSDQDDIETKSGVRLMTIHASKGLEFDTVFVAGLEDGLFPMRRDESKRKSEEGEEERRLFYVAVTRAKRKLLLSYTQTRMVFGSRQVNLPSEFIYDIPENLIVREEGAFGLLRKPLIRIEF